MISYCCILVKSRVFTLLWKTLQDPAPGQLSILVTQYLPHLLYPHWTPFGSLLSVSLSSELQTLPLTVILFPLSFSWWTSYCNSKCKGSEVASCLTYLRKSRVTPMAGARKAMRRREKQNPCHGQRQHWCGLSAILRTLGFILDQKRSHKGF